MRDLVNLVRKVMRDVERRALLSVARGVLSAITDSEGLQSLQIEFLEDELRDGVERFQNYGFSSHPHPGAEAAVMFVGGDRAHGLAVAVDDRARRPTDLSEGETKQYSSFGQYVYMDKEGILNIYAPKGIRVISGDFITLKAATSIMRHAGTYDGYDVAGYAEVLHHTGDTSWERKSYVTGSSLTETELAISPPELPDWTLP